MRWCHQWTPFPDREPWERVPGYRTACGAPECCRLCSSVLLCRHAVTGWGGLGRWLWGGAVGVLPFISSLVLECPCCRVTQGSLLAVLQPEVRALSDGQKCLKRPRYLVFGHVALVLPYFRNHLFSEMPALPPVQLPS